MPATKPTVKKQPKPSTPGTIVLQWLTYAFWGLTNVAIAYVVAMLVGYTLSDAWSDDPAGIAYGVAAIAILLPIAFITDILYSRREPEHKQGIAGFVMIIHAVLFALVAVGALATVAFNIVGLVVTSGDVTGSYIAIATSATVSILFIKLLGCTIRHQLFSRFRLYFRILMLIIGAVVSFLAVIGPVSDAIATKEDRAIRDNIVALTSSMSEYVSGKDALPGSIEEFVASNPTSIQYNQAFGDSISDQAAKGVITYTPNTKALLIEESDGTTSTTFYYEVCGVYTHSLKSQNYYSGPSAQVDSDGYSDWLQNQDIHPGTLCQSLKVTNYK
jgi:hypothetical protein